MQAKSKTLSDNDFIFSPKLFDYSAACVDIDHNTIWCAFAGQLRREHIARPADAIPMEVKSQ